MAVPPGSTVTSNPPVFEVTVCAWESPFLTMICAPGATESGTVNLKSVIEMTTSPAPTDAEGASSVGGVLVLGVDGVGIDEVVEVEGDAVLSVADEPQADRPHTSAGTTARSVIVRVMVVPSRWSGPRGSHRKEFGTDRQPDCSKTSILCRRGVDACHHALIRLHRNNFRLPIDCEFC